jgi:mono/diheme cytochrome c family protein
MIPARMSRPVRVLFLTVGIIAASGLAVACGSQKISVPRSDAQLYHGAVLFSQRCAGCHTLSYAATNGSAANVRTAQANNGPNFNVRCERTTGGQGIARVLYAIENGGFSGAIMPQNVVVGQDALDVARFVVTYAGRQAPRIPGTPICTTEPVGSLPSLASLTQTSAVSSTARTPKTTKRVAAAAGVATRAAGRKTQATP